MTQPRSQTDYGQTVRFSARYLLAWAALLAAGCLLIPLLIGFHEKASRFVWAGGTIGIAIAVAGLVSHMQRVHALAGRLDAELLGRRHVRALEFPCAADEALDMVETVLRAQRSLDGIDVDTARHRVRARLKNLDRYTMDSGGSARRNLVNITLVPGDGVTRATLRFEPDCAAWQDLLLLDSGSNLDNAQTITAQLEARIAEHRRATRLAAEKSALQQQLTRAQLKLLQAQVEPHFLYNTLAHAQLLTRSEPIKAEAMLGHLIDFLRSSLPGANESAATSTLGQEVDHSLAYLEILKIRMGDRLQFVVELPDMLRATPLPPLMMQTLVENAIKHGLEPQPGGGTLWIRAEAEPDSVRITVADDGAGFQDSSTGTGLGLQNVRERLELTYGGRASLALAPNFPRGVTATIRLPR